MKNIIFVVLITFLTLNSYSQITFENGYFIDNKGSQTDCLIKNMDWNNNPTEFEYKLSENSNIIHVTIQNIKEFGILNYSKYERFTVKIDRSSERINTLSFNRNPEFTEETLFLKVIIAGNATLYQYRDKNADRYFYNMDNYTEQLIFKSYKKTDTQVAQNKKYKQQLFLSLKCDDISMDDINGLEYYKKELMNFFIKYNKCKQDDFVNFEQTKKESKSLFNLYIRPGLKSSSLSIENNRKIGRDLDFGSALTFRIGLEAEYIMPFNKNKWALILEPTYQYFKTEGELADQTVKANYTSIEVPIGIRHYFYLNENSKLFINASILFHLNLNSKIEFETIQDLDIKGANNLAFGFGYNYNKKYSIELSYQTNRDIISSYFNWGSDYSGLSIIFGYNIF